MSFGTRGVHSGNGQPQTIPLNLSPKRVCVVAIQELAEPLLQDIKKVTTQIKELQNGWKSREGTQVSKEDVEAVTKATDLIGECPTLKKQIPTLRGDIVRYLTRFKQEVPPLNEGDEEDVFTELKNTMGRVDELFKTLEASTKSLQKDLPAWQQRSEKLEAFLRMQTPVGMFKTTLMNAGLWWTGGALVSVAATAAFPELPINNCAVGLAALKTWDNISSATDNKANVVASSIGALSTLILVSRTIASITPQSIRARVPDVARHFLDKGPGMNKAAPVVTGLLVAGTAAYWTKLSEKVQKTKAQIYALPDEGEKMLAEANTAAARVVHGPIFKGVASGTTVFTVWAAVTAARAGQYDKAASYALAAVAAGLLTVSPGSIPQAIFRAWSSGTSAAKTPNVEPAAPSETPRAPSSATVELIPSSEEPAVNGDATADMD